MIGDITSWIMNLMQTHGPITVVVGVLIESVIVPIPSPLIIMGAGAILVQPGLTVAQAFAPIFFTIVLPGSAASTVGALLTFYIAYWGGKPMIDRCSRFLGFTWEDVLVIEKKLAGRVNLMIFLLRALPIMPLSLISAAAGVLRFPVGQFCLWTFLGSLPRCLILAYLGYLTRGTYQGIAGNINKVESVVSGLIVLSAIGIILWLRARMKKTAKPN